MEEKEVILKNGWVAIHTNAIAKGDEVTSSLGIIIERQAQEYEQPTTGTIIGIADNVPLDKIDIEVGDVVLLPTGKVYHLTDPDIVHQRIYDKKKQRQLVVTHWTSIQAVYKKGE